VKPVVKSGARVEARKRRRRGNVIAGVAILFGAATLAAVVTGFLILSQNLSDAHRDNALLAEQVKSMGGTPVAGPKGDTGAAGLVGPSGPPGPSGAPGSPGKAAPTITPSPGPTGPPGPSGVAGEPGADSTVPGPTGPVGPAGQDATGAPGKDGENGQDGQNGSPPSEWTYQDPQGNTYRCTPVDDFDPDNPRYRCVLTSTPSPTSSPPASDPSPTYETSPEASPSPSEAFLVSLLDGLGG
jgi:hypothetical protein